MAQRSVSATESHNEVRLVGRLAAAPMQRTLPSGDELVTWRLIVRRPDAIAPAQTIDTIDCVSWRSGVQRQALQWTAGETVECCGALRRRFWRSEAGPASRCEVEVGRARRVRIPSAEPP